MGALTLTSSRRRHLRPLIEAAIHNELRLLENGVRRTEKRLKSFEEKYNLSTNDFLQRYEKDELSETLDCDEWVGEYRLLGRLREKVSTLQEIHIED